jgi:hypothetical protein
LFGWYLYQHEEETYLDFDAKQPLTRQLAVSKLIHNKRLAYYVDGDTPPGEAPEYRFNLGEQAQCFLDFRGFDVKHVSMPLSCVLGTIRYQIKTLDNGNWVGFRIDNRTDLESGSHIAGRFPPEFSGSVEDLIEHGEISGNTLLFSVFRTKDVVSILKRRSHGQTGEFTDMWGNTHQLGGANFSQTYVWKEKRDPCQPSFWPSLDLDIQPWTDYASYTITPPDTLP